MRANGFVHASVHIGTHTVLRKTKKSRIEGREGLQQVGSTCGVCKHGVDDIFWSSGGSLHCTPQPPSSLSLSTAHCSPPLIDIAVPQHTDRHRCPTLLPTDRHRCPTTPQPTSTSLSHNTLIDIAVPHYYPLIDIAVPQHHNPHRHSWTPNPHWHCCPTTPHRYPHRHRCHTSHRSVSLPHSPHRHRRCTARINLAACHTTTSASLPYSTAPHVSILSVCSARSRTHLPRVFYCRCSWLAVTGVIAKWSVQFRFRSFIHQVLQQGKCLESGKHTSISKQQHWHTSTSNPFALTKLVSCWILSCPLRPLSGRNTVDPVTSNFRSDPLVRNIPPASEEL